MLECLIIGDSIAVGVSQVRTECQSIAKVGINSRDWNRHNLEKLTSTKTLIISLGANDYKGIDTEVNLRKLRTRVNAERVFWLLPNKTRKPEQVQAVERVAQEFKDTVIPRPEANISADGVHPTGKGYKLLAEKTR